MKKIALIAAVIMSSVSFSYAQKYCVIDSKYILDKLPEYANAQKQLDDISSSWEKEVDAKMVNVDQMYRSYQAERPMLSEDARKKKEDEIVAKEREAKELQKKYFGYEGELFRERQKLVKPIQDKVYTSVQNYANQRGYDMIYDKSGGVTIFYANPTLDKSDEIIKAIKSNK